jgi:hypothetical protein
MPVLFSYSFSAAPAPSLAPEKPMLHSYDYSEFRLALSPDWQQLSGAERNTLHFNSAELGASITVSLDFLEIAQAKAAAMAEKSLSARLELLEHMAPGRVRLLQRNIKPHSGGGGLELSLAAEVPGEQVCIYLGYVTSRKILNFSLVCRPGRQAAAALFNEIVLNFRPRLP